MSQSPFDLIAECTAEGFQVSFDPDGDVLAVLKLTDRRADPAWSTEVTIDWLTPSLSLGDVVLRELPRMRQILLSRRPG